VSPAQPRRSERQVHLVVLRWIRIDEVVVFSALSEDDLNRIIELLLDHGRRRVRAGPRTGSSAYDSLEVQREDE
jgi:hypothetical protein